MPLKVQVASSDPLDTKADLVAIGVREGDDSIFGALDRALGGGFADLVRREDFSGKKDSRLSIATLGRLPASRVLLLGLGKDELSDAAIRLYAATAAKAAQADKAESLAIAAPKGVETERFRFLAEGLVLGAYRFTKYLTGERRPKKDLARAAILVAKKSHAAEGRAAALGAAIGESINVTRDLQNEPPNELTPAALAAFAAKTARANGLKVTVMDFRRLQQAGMKLIVAVGQGSVNKPALVHMTYTPKKKAKKKIVLVGKGLTFDSGGLCIKPAQGMGDMKTDMSGAANVVGFMAAVAALAPADVEVHGILGCAENMPDGEAYRPGDVFGSLDGKTVEIINTDAEGRLVLADCLTYASRLRPDLIVDNATLTGACIVALGANCSGFYATSDELGASFDRAAREAGEQFWRLPLLEDLKDQLKSDIADLKHTGDRYGGSITAALFLREFVGKNIPWIHCDIAGPSLSTRAYGIYPKGGTGHGVLTFLRFLENG
jgi:leucyl aminopeptidase